MGRHARLSPSASATWLACPGSVLLGESLPRREEKADSAANEGSAAHDLGYWKAMLAFGKCSPEEYAHQRDRWEVEWFLFTQDPDAVADFEQYTDDYVAFLQERFAEYPGSQIFLEQRVYPDVPECDGTADAIILSPTHIEIIDLKYGKGVRVYAKNNSQLRIYALGGLLGYADLLGIPVEEVLITVYQPRIENFDTEVMLPSTLRDWRETVVLPRAEEALQPGARFAPSIEACRWCPASGRCSAQAADVFATETHIVPGTLTPEEMADALDRLAFVRDWANAVEKVALELAYADGVRIPRYKCVLSGGNRRVVDPDAAIETLHAEGFEESQYMNIPPPKVKGIGDLERLLGKPRFRALLEEPGIVRKPEGGPSLVPEDDPRPEVDRHAEAARLFAAQEEEPNEYGGSLPA